MGKDNNFLINIIGNYFEYNKMTKEKIKFIENETGLDLSEYKKLLNDAIKWNIFNYIIYHMNNIIWFGNNFILNIELLFYISFYLIRRVLYFKNKNKIFLIINL